MNTKRLLATARRTGASAVAVAVASVAFSATAQAQSGPTPYVVFENGEERATPIITSTDLIVHQDEEATQSGAITGSAVTIIKYNAGTLTLTGSNDYFKTVFTGGTLAVTGETINSELLFVNHGSKLLVTGAGASFTVTGGDITDFSAGGGKAFLDVLDGASFTNLNGKTVVGSSAYAGASVQVSGVGSSFTTQGLEIANGQSSVRADGGATVESGDIEMSGGSISVFGDGTTWIAGDTYLNHSWFEVGEGASFTADSFSLFQSNLNVGAGATFQSGDVEIGDSSVVFGNGGLMPTSIDSDGPANSSETISNISLGDIVGHGAYLIVGPDASVNAGNVVLSSPDGSSSSALRVNGGSFTATSLTLDAASNGQTYLTVMNGGIISVAQDDSAGLTSADRTLYAGRDAHINIGGYGSAGTLDVDRIIFGRDSSLSFTHDDMTTFSAEIDGRIYLEVFGGGTTIFTADSGNVARRGIQVYAGSTVQFGNGGTTGWIDSDVNITSGGVAFRGAIGSPSELSKLVINRSDDVTFSRKLSGDGTLVKEGTGTLTITRRNRDFSGDVEINNGTLALVDRGNLRNSEVTIGEQGTFDVSAVTRDRVTVTAIHGGGSVVLGDKALRLLNVSDSFRGTISGTGSLSVGGSQFTVRGPSTFTGTTILDQGTGLVFVDVGTLLGNIEVNSGLITFDRGGTFNYGGSIIGLGGISHIGQGLTNLSGDNSLFEGVADIYNGLLAINGAFGGSVDVHGGILGGSGTILGDLIQRSKGLVAPGNSIGTLTVEGDYSIDRGTIEIEAVLAGDYASTDQLIVKGDASGRGYVRVLNQGGLGSETTNGLRFLTVHGDSDVQLTLENPDYVLDGQGVMIAGAYGYVLEKNGVLAKDGAWYLRSNVEHPNGSRVTLYQPSVPVYEAYAASLGAISNLNTFQQRVGNRQTSSLAGAEIWGRVEGGHLRNQAVESSSLASTTTDVRKYQIGTDVVAKTDANGSAFVFGFNVFSGRVNTDVSSFLGNGHIKTSGYGVGFSLTRQNVNGFYADAQAQFSWTEGTLQSATLGALATKNGGDTRAFSVEVGQRLAVGSAVALTPQVQLTYTNAKFDAFTDLRGVSVALEDGQRLRGRAGLALDRRGEGSHVYAIVDLNYDLLDGTRVNVAGATIGSRDARAWASAGIGGSQSFGGVAIFGEVSAISAIGGLSDSYGMKGNAGIRLRF